MNPDTIDWARAWDTVSPAVQDANINGLLSLVCFGGFAVICLLGTLYNVYTLRKRGQSAVGATIGGLAAMAAAGAIGIGGALSMGAEAHALHARVGQCTDTGHGARHMALTVTEAVGFDADGYWPIEPSADGWRVDPALCENLVAGSEHIFLCATGGLCVDTL